MKSSMDWIVWEMLEKLKADKDILTRMRDEAKEIYLETLKELEGDDEQYGLDSVGDVRKVEGR